MNKYTKHFLHLYKNKIAFLTLTIKNRSGKMINGKFVKDAIH